MQTLLRTLNGDIVSGSKQFKICNFYNLLTRFFYPILVSGGVQIIFVAAFESKQISREITFKARSHVAAKAISV